MADPAQQLPAIVPAAADPPRQPRRPALFADYLLEERIPEPEPRFPNLRWAAEQLLKLILVGSVVAMIAIDLWDAL